MENKIYIQFVMVEFRNCAPFIYKIISKNKITLSKVVSYFKKTEDWSEERDNITLINEITTIRL